MVVTKKAVKKKPVKKKAAKKAPAKKRIAKKRTHNTAVQPALTGMEEELEYSPRLKKAVKQYADACLQSSQAAAHKKDRKLRAIEVMKEEGRKRVRYQEAGGNWKWLVRKSEDKLAIESADRQKKKK